MLEFLAWIAAESFVALFVVFAGLLLASSEIGYRLGQRVFHRRTAEETARSGIGFIVGGMLALLAFLLGIALSIAEARYDDRREVVLDEANAIGTSWLRAGLVGGEDGAALQRMLVDYTRLRIRAVRDVSSPEQEAEVHAATGTMQNDMWAVVTRIGRERPTPISALLIASFNDTFDLATSSRRAFTSGVPPTVYRLLIWTSLISVGAMGFSFGASGSRQAVMTVLLLLLWTSTVVMIADINRSRHGSVSVTPEPLEWTLEGFGPPR